MLRKWRNKARISANRIPSDVPAGHVAVCVGTSCRRFVVRASYLNHPFIKKLLIQAEEEFGFTNHGPLAIPCDESLFEEVLRYISRSESGNSTRFVNLEDFQGYCHVGLRNNLDFWPDSRPLLHGFAEKTIWQVFYIKIDQREIKMVKTKCFASDTVVTQSDLVPLNMKEGIICRVHEKCTKHQR